MSTEATAVAKVAVRARCEACDHQFSFETKLIGTASSLTDTKDKDALAAEATKKLNGQLEVCHRGRYLGVEKCPKCSHIQSWMLKDQKQGRQGVLAAFLIWSVVLAFVSTRVLYNYRTELGLESIWNWISIPIILISSFVYYQLAKLVLALTGRPAESVKVETLSSHPLDVTVLKQPEVAVVREEAY